MSHFICRDKYRLELHWKALDFKSDEVALLESAFFSGPVLNDAAKLEAPDFIDLDLTPQLLVVADSYYIVRLAWDGVEYQSDDKVSLKGARLENSYLKSFHKFSSTDYILINTEKHEEATHAYHLVYDSKVMRSDGKPHKYEKSQ